MSRKDSMLAMLRREQAEITRRMLALERVPDEDTYPDGAMVRVVVDGERLTYLLLKVITSATTAHGPRPESRWYFTGTIHRSPAGERRYLLWDDLQRWLGTIGCDSWEELIAKSDVPLDADHPLWSSKPGASVKPLTTDLREQR